MVKLQEYLDNIMCPTKKEKEWLSHLDMGEISRNSIYSINQSSGTIGHGLDGGILDLSEYPNLERIWIDNRFRSPLIKLKLGNHPKLTDIRVSKSEITSLDISGCSALTKLWINDSLLFSVDFLNQIPNPEKLEELVISGNNIQPTNIEVFSRFVNLKFLHLGNDSDNLKKGKYNKFHGSFEGWKNLTKLEDICIEATDVYGGLEYLPPYINNFNCSPNNTNAKCKNIQDELRGFNYNLHSWQLAHPELMKITCPELFTTHVSSHIWIRLLEDKIKRTKLELEQTKALEGKEKKAQRLESERDNLVLAKQTLEKSTQTDSSVADKQTQTELTGEDIEKALEIQRQVQILAKK